jgi:hypothetical protein
MEDIRMNAIQEDEMELSIYPFNPKRKYLSKEEKEIRREKRYQKRITTCVNVILITTIVILLISIACLGKSYAMLFL